MLYFAYGSNMLRERICHPNRVPGARWLQTGYVIGRKLAFHKRSKDGSGKCDIPLSGRSTDRVYGVVYEVPEEQMGALDAVEALGHGYCRTTIEVLSEDLSPLTADVYLGDPPYLDPALSPYTWYKDLVLCGARQNGFSQQLLNAIADVPALDDPLPNRPAAREAAEAMKAFRETLLETQA